MEILIFKYFNLEFKPEYPQNLKEIFARKNEELIAEYQQNVEENAEVTVSEQYKKLEEITELPSKKSKNKSITNSKRKPVHINWEKMNEKNW